AEIGRVQHLVAFRHDAEYRYAEDVLDVVDVEHFPARSALRIVARDEEMFLHALALFGPLGLGIKQAYDPVGIAHRRYLGVGDDDGQIGKPHRQRCAALDTGRTVADDPIEFAAQFPDHSRDTVVGEGVLVPRLRGWQQPERFKTFVADERLRQFRDPL